MLTRRIVLPRGGRDEGEKPFWISFADLMSALMVLFLVALTIELNKANEQREIAERSRIEAIEQKEKAERSREVAEAAQRQLEREREELARTKAELEEEKRKRDDGLAKRKQELAELTRRIRDAVAPHQHEGVTLKGDGTVIDFGPRALFQLGQHTLTAEQINTLRKFAPDLLQAVRSDVGQKWLRRIVVEGFTSSDWTYLQNLNLSLQRSERVLCALLAESWEQANMPVNPAAPLAPLSEQDRSDIKRLSLVGGYSSNSAKERPEDSRRIELRLEFFQQEELDANGRPPRPAVKELPTGKCPI